MPPPATFFEIDVLPYAKTVTVAEFNVANQIWFQFVTGVDVSFGQWTLVAASAEFSNIYESDGTTLVKRLASNNGWWYRLVAGTYYIKIDTNPVGPIATDLSYQADTRPMDDVEFEAQSVLIPGDSSLQLAAIVMEPDGTIPTFVSAIPASEIGDALPNGYVLIHDQYGKYTLNAVILFNPDLSFNQAIVPSTPFTGFPRICHSATDFYATNPVTGQVWKITTAGVCSLFATIAEIAFGGVTCVGITSDASIIYFALNDNTGNFLKYVVATAITTTHYTIPGFTPPNDFIALTYDNNPGDLIVLPDGSFVSWWGDDSSNQSILLHINSNGTLATAWTMGATETIDHLAYASTTLSTHIKIYLFLDFLALTARIGNFNLSTGVFTTSFTTDLFTDGRNVNTGDQDKFGPPESCPFVTLFVGVTTPIGIFKIVDSKRDDTINDTGDTAVDDVAIPDPTFKTGLIP